MRLSWDLYSGFADQAAVAAASHDYAAAKDNYSYARLRVRPEMSQLELMVAVGLTLYSMSWAVLTLIMLVGGYAYGVQLREVMIALRPASLAHASIVAGPVRAVVSGPANLHWQPPAVGREQRAELRGQRGGVVRTQHLGANAFKRLLNRAQVADAVVEHRDAVARLQCDGKTSCHRNRDISSAMRWCSSSRTRPCCNIRPAAWPACSVARVGVVSQGHVGAAPWFTVLHHAVDLVQHGHLLYTMKGKAKRDALAPLVHAGDPSAERVANSC